MRAHIGLLDDPPGLAEDGGGDEDLLADHGVVLVVGVVGVAELAVGAELELEELVPELALVPHVVPQVELRIAAGRRHCRRHDSFGWLLRVDREDFFSLSNSSREEFGFWPPSLLFLLDMTPEFDSGFEGNSAGPVDLTAH